MRQVTKRLLTVVYGVGVLLVLVLSGLALSGTELVPFPDAMLPMTLSELAIRWLSLGTLPMLLACWGVCARYPGGGRGRKLLLFSPGVLCALCALWWAGVWTVGMLNTAFHGIG